MTATNLSWATPSEQDSGAVGLHAESVADVIERLFVVFGPRLGLSTVVQVVRDCRRDLDIVSGPQLPELLERLAHQRLSNLIAQNAI